MGVTGITENKLFKVRTLDQSNLYQVGVNGVTSVSDPNDGQITIKYVIDDIEYTSFITEDDRDDISKFSRIPYIDKGRKTYVQKLNLADSYSIANTGVITPELIKGSTETKHSTHLGNGIRVNRIVRPKSIVPSLNGVGDTIYITPKYSYDDFGTGEIYKKEKYVGLIDHPIVESDLFIERDEYTIFERHQRLSEINNLAELTNYRGGYFKNIKTL